jgi:hypothetical protein
VLQQKSWEVRRILGGKATSMNFFRTTCQNFFFLGKDFSEEQSPNHWRTIICKDYPSDCGAFTRHCLWMGSSPQAKARG